jgi:hypothetical protein
MTELIDAWINGCGNQIDCRRRFLLMEKEQARTYSCMGAESLIMIHFISVAAPGQAFIYNTALGNV